MHLLTCNGTSAAVVALVALAACADSTGPRTPAHPMVGTYDLTTTLTTYTYGSTGTAGSIITVASGSAAFSGTVVIGNSALTGPAGTVTLPLFSASVDEKSCDASAPKCAGGTFNRSVEYHNGFHRLTVTGDTAGVSGNFQTDGGEALTLVTGKFAGDSIVGTMTWETNFGSSTVSRYSGTYIARRRP